MSFGERLFKIGGGNTNPNKEFVVVLLMRVMV